MRGGDCSRIIKGQRATTRRVAKRLYERNASVKFNVSLVKLKKGFDAIIQRVMCGREYQRERKECVGESDSQ